MIFSVDNVGACSKLHPAKKVPSLKSFVLPITHISEAPPPATTDPGFADFAGYCAPVGPSRWFDPRQFPALQREARFTLRCNLRDISLRSRNPQHFASAYLMSHTMLTRRAPGLSVPDLYDGLCARAPVPVSTEQLTKALVDWSYVRSVPLRFEGRQAAFVADVAFATPPKSEPELRDMLHALSGAR